jgi:hypothetical protein
MMALLHFVLPLLPLPLFCFSGSSSQAAIETNTLTSSGADSPNATDHATAATSGSIAVGEGAKYLETGATDASGLTAAYGSTINIGDPNALKEVTDLAGQFVAATQNPSGGGGSTVVTSAPPSDGGLNYKTIGLIVAILAAIIGLFTFLKPKKA